MSKKIKKQNVYWDADCFLSYLQREQTYENCAGILEEARAGNILIITSVFTITEVLGGGSGKLITRETQAEIDKFFKSPFITVVNVDRSLAEYARSLFWDYKIPK
ncbi:MAG: type II toxin-antitoxin system VapC family toxin, partial [Vampirovibrionales bacterium]